MGEIRDMRDRLQTELTDATSELTTHMASWEYAFAMGSSRDGSHNHPMSKKTRAQTERLEGRCRDLRARLAEFES